MAPETQRHRPRCSGRDTTLPGKKSNLQIERINDRSEESESETKNTAISIPVICRQRKRTYRSDTGDANTPAMALPSRHCRR